MLMLDPCLVGFSSVSERDFDSMGYISDVHDSRPWSTRPLVRRSLATGHWATELTLLRRGKKAVGGLASGIFCAAFAPAHLGSAEARIIRPIPQQLSCLKHRATRWHPIRRNLNAILHPKPHPFSASSGRTIVIFVARTLALGFRKCGLYR